MLKEKTMVETIRDLSYDNPMYFFCEFDNELGRSIEDYTDEELDIFNAVNTGSNVIIFQEEDSKTRVTELLSTIHISSLISYKMRKSTLYYTNGTPSYVDSYVNILKEFCKSTEIPDFRKYVKMYDIKCGYRHDLAKLERSLKTNTGLIMFDDMSSHENSEKFTEFFDKAIDNEESAKDYRYVLVLDQDRYDDYFVESISHLFNHDNVSTFHL